MATAKASHKVKSSVGKKTSSSHSTGTEVKRLTKGKTYSRESAHQSTAVGGASAFGFSMFSMGGKQQQSQFGKSGAKDDGLCTRKRKAICVVCGVTVVVFLLAIVFTLISLSFFVQEEPKVEASEVETEYRTKKITFTTRTPRPKPTTNANRSFDVPSLTDFCTEKFGYCFYYKQRFVDSCQKMQCSNVGIYVSVQNELLSDGVTRSKLVFRPLADDEAHITKPPDHCGCKTPDGKVGRCLDRICVAKDAKDHLMIDYEMLSKTDSGFEHVTAPQMEECVFVAPFVNRLFPIIFQTSCKNQRLPDECIEYPLHFKKCTKPRPYLGGRLCYHVDQESGIIPTQYVPIYFGSYCGDLHCKVSEFDVPNPDVRPLDCKITPDVQCGYYVYKNWVTRDDYAGCCSEHFPTDRTICAGGMCMRSPLRG